VKFIVFTDASIDKDGRLYEGKIFPGGLLEFEIQVAFLMDLNNDESKDVILPIMKGYSSGEDTRTPLHRPSLYERHAHF
jgi:hypothetical protein